MSIVSKTAPIKGWQRLALVSAQKVFLFLGDLSRYREQLNNTKNYGRAKKWYVKAQQVLPTNGMPYNQLAIISLYTVNIVFRKSSSKFTQFLEISEKEI